MTEQFSQEYIAYILSDEAKVLQKLWVPAAGDWILLTHRGEQEVNCLGTMDDRKDWAEWAREALKYRDMTWLPTLFQLIGVIEGRWPRVEMGSYLLDGVRHHWMRGLEMPPKTSVGRPIVRETDIMLAAAQLAVRAVEGEAR